MANTTNYNWETPDDSDLVKDGAAAIRTLGNSIDTTTKALNPETTLGDIAYRSSTSNTNTRLPIGSNGQILGVSAGVPAWINNDQGDITEVQAGTGISVASGTGPIPVVTNTVATAYDAKGDLIVGTGADTFSKLSVGTNGYTLLADSTQTSGVKWAVDPVADVVTTAGDILYATAADTVTRLGIGTAGQVLKVNSGATAPEWGAAPASGFVGAVAYKSATTQSISNATDTIVTFDAEEFDTDGFHSGVTNTGRMTIPAGKGGKYLCIANIIFAANATGQRSINFMKNGASAGAFQQLASAGSGTSTIFCISGILDLAATDYVEVNVYQNSTGSLNVNNNQAGTRFAIQYLGA